MIFFIWGHMLICILVAVLLKLDIVKTREHLMPFVILVPYVGAMVLFIEQWLQKKKIYSTRETGYEKLEVDDLRFKKIILPVSGENTDVIPLEEAMEMNGSGTRRSLIMDILKGNPEEYVSVLESASLSSDTELSHYATTSMIAIQTGYEAKLGELEARMKEIRGLDEIDPAKEVDIDEFEKTVREKENTVELVTKKVNMPSKGYIKLLDEYITIIDKYMGSGLISGAVYEIYQEKFDDSLVEMLGYVKDNKKYWLMFVTNRIETGRLKNMDKLLELIRCSWPEDEKCYMAYMAYAHKTSNDELALEVIETVKEKDIYLSKAGKAWYKFWKGEYENPF